MSTSLSGKQSEGNIWLPSQGKYLANLKLVELRDYLYALFAEAPADPVSLERGTFVLQRVWGNLGRDRRPQRSHAYRHLLALQLLGLVAPHGNREGYALTPSGARLLGISSPGTPPSLQEAERRFLATAMFTPPEGMHSPLLEFARLFAPTAPTAEDFVECGQPITLRRFHPEHLQAITATSTIVISGAPAITHVLLGSRQLFLEANLVAELPAANASPFRQLFLFPVKQVEASQMDATVEQVVSYIRERLSYSARLPIPDLGTELRPRMRLTASDYQAILKSIAQRYASEFYFDRLSASLIAKHEGAYVQIDGYWRASIVRY